jgi:hypothetical protein
MGNHEEEMRDFWILKLYKDFSSTKGGGGQLLNPTPSRVRDFREWIAKGCPGAWLQMSDNKRRVLEEFKRQEAEE